MSSFRKFLKGILLESETSDPDDNLNGSIWHNSTAGRIKSYVQGAIRTLVSEDQSQTLTNKTVDADNNTISNLEDDNIKSGAAIARNKLAAGTANRVQVNDGSGALSSSTVTTTEVQLLSGIVNPLITTSDTQILTNKDIDGGAAANNRRITIPKDTRSNLDALDRKEGTILYDLTNSKVVFDDGLSLNELDSTYTTIGFTANTSTTSATANVTPINFTNVLNNTHPSAYVSGIYTVPANGWYIIHGQTYTGGNHTIYVFINDVSSIQGGSYGSVIQASEVNGLRYLNAGDTVHIRIDATATISGGAVINRFSLIRVGQ